MTRIAIRLLIGVLLAILCFVPATPPTAAPGGNSDGCRQECNDFFGWCQAGILEYCSSVYPRESPEFNACVDQFLPDICHSFVVHCKYHCRPGIEPDPLRLVPQERVAPRGGDAPEMTQAAD